MLFAKSENEGFIVLTTSFIIFFCMLFLALGCFLAYAQMKNKISGENVPVADILKQSLDFLKSSSK